MRSMLQNAVGKRLSSNCSVAELEMCLIIFLKIFKLKSMDTHLYYDLMCVLYMTKVRASQGPKMQKILNYVSVKEDQSMKIFQVFQIGAKDK